MDRSPYDDLKDALFDVADQHQRIRDATHSGADRASTDALANDLLRKLDIAYSALARYINRPQ